jgi:glycerol-3-phosphate acyltransferase PlsX
MGGDYAPEAAIRGALIARDDFGIPVVLVGDSAKLADTDSLEVVHASEAIGMHEEPGTAVRKKKDSSLVVGSQLVKDGKASAIVSAGNTGAAMGAALLRCGRIKGVARPAIATAVPVKGSHPVVLLDSGANTDCQPAWLAQFATMGAAYSRVRFGVQSPAVATLTNGEEPGKGNELSKATQALLAESKTLNFVGNVEGRDLLFPGPDVVVTDGFTGNVVVKTLEGSSKFFASTIKGAIRSSTLTKLAGLVLKGPLKRAFAGLDPDEHGGAILLGVSGVCIISHGSSSPKAIASAIRVAAEMVEANVIAEVTKSVSRSSDSAAPPAAEGTSKRGA